MAPTPNEIPPGSATPPPEQPGVTATALDELSHKLTVMGNVGTEMGNLFEAVKDANIQKILESFKSIFAIAFVGMLSWKQGFKNWETQRAQQRGESVEHPPSGPRAMLPDEKGRPQNFENEKESNMRNRLVNMANATKEDYKTWYEVNGRIIKKWEPGAVKKWGLNEAAKKKNPKDVASDFVMKNGSSALIEKTPDTYEEFETSITQKLYPLEKDREKAVEKSAHFLSKS